MIIIVGLSLLTWLLLVLSGVIVILHLFYCEIIMLLTQHVDNILDCLACSDKSASYVDSCDVSVG